MLARFVFILALFFSVFLVAEQVFAQQEEQNVVSTTSVDQILTEQAGPFGCSTREACREVCDLPENRVQCLDFALETGIMTEGQVLEARRFLNGGPNGCSSASGCREFCSIEENKQMCIDFAEEKGLISHERAMFARSARYGELECDDESSCREFCRKPGNSGRCLAFAVKHDLIDTEGAKAINSRIRVKVDEDAIERLAEEDSDTREIDRYKAAKIVETEGGPGGCSTFGECRSYCAHKDNYEECLEFMEEHEMFPEAYVERVKRFLAAEGPQGCRGGECRAVCDHVENREACLSFAKENNFGPAIRIMSASPSMRMQMPDRIMDDAEKERMRRMMQMQTENTSPSLYPEKNIMDDVHDLQTDEIRRFENLQNLKRERLRFGGIVLEPLLDLIGDFFE